MANSCAVRNTRMAISCARQRQQPSSKVRQLDLHLGSLPRASSAVRCDQLASFAEFECWFEECKVSLEKGSSVLIARDLRVSGGCRCAGVGTLTRCAWEGRTLSDHRRFISFLPSRDGSGSASTYRGGCHWLGHDVVESVCMVQVMFQGFNRRCCSER